MDSDKAVFCYFCTGISIFAFLMAAVVAIAALYKGPDPGDFDYSLKASAVGGAFLIPPVLYKILVRKKVKKENPEGKGCTVLIVCLFLILCGIAFAFLKIGFIKTALALYFLAALCGLFLGALFILTIRQPLFPPD